MSLSGTKFRKMLRAGEEIPAWFAFPSVVKVSGFDYIDWCGGEKIIFIAL